MKTDVMRTRLYQVKTYERKLAPNIKASGHVAIVSVESRRLVNMVSIYVELYVGSCVRTGFV